MAVPAKSLPLGRPPAIGPATPEVAERILEAVEQCWVPAAAAAYAGISRECLYDALRRGRRALDGRLPKGTRRTKDLAYLADFVDRYTRAVAQAEGSTISAIRSAGLNPSVERRVTRKILGTDKETGEAIYGEEVQTIERPGDPANLRWLAERRWEHWAPRTRQVVSGPDGGPIPIEVAVEALLGKWRQARNPDAIDAEEVPAIGPGEDEGG